MPTATAKETKVLADQEARELVRRLIEDAQAREGLSGREMARRLGVNHGWLNDFLERQKIGLSRRMARRLESYFHLPLGTLRPETPANHSKIGVISPASVAVTPLATGRCPVLGYAGERGLVLSKKPVGYVDPLPSLAGVEGAFAVYAPDDTMTPRFKRGEAVHINPYRPVTDGDEVLVEFDDHTAHLRILKQRLDDRVVLGQYNPSGAESVVPKAKIARIYAVDGVVIHK